MSIALCMCRIITFPYGSKKIKWSYLIFFYHIIIHNSVPTCSWLHDFLCHLVGKKIDICHAILYKIHSFTNSIVVSLHTLPMFGHILIEKLSMAGRPLSLAENNTNFIRVSLWILRLFPFLWPSISLLVYFFHLSN